MQDRIFPQNDNQGRGMSHRFHASLEIYKALMSNNRITNQDLKEECGNGHCTNLKFHIMKQAIQLGKEFCSNFDENE